MDRLLFIILLPFFLVGVIPTAIIFALSGKDPGPTRNAVDFFVTSVMAGVGAVFVVLVAILVYR